MQAQRLSLMLESVGKLVRRGALSNAINLLSKLRPVDIAKVLSQLPRSEREATFHALVKHGIVRAAESLSEMEKEGAVELLTSLAREDVSRLLQELPSDDAALLVAELPEELREELLESKDEQLTDVQELLAFADKTAGRIMTPDYFALDENVTVAEAITALQRRSEEFEMVSYLYVVDSRNHLLGVVSLRQLLLSPPSTPLRKIMIGDVIKVATDTDQEEVARVVATYNLLAVPVIDEEHKLAGIITVDDVIDVIREEATEDIFALAGVDAADQALGSPMSSVRRRLPGLLVSLATAMIAVAIVWAYRDMLENWLPVAILIPIVAAMGSNAATQTMTVVVRAMGLGEVEWQTGGRLFMKEALVGAINGLAVGVLACAAVSLWFGLKLGVLLGVTMVSSIFLAAMLGTLIPIVLKRLRFDPAVASSVLVLALTDVITFLCYLGLAALLRKQFGF